MTRRRSTSPSRSTLGVRISEFPTTVLAAAAAEKYGQLIVMGAPNIVRGGSQSGNVAAAELLELGLLHILSSDYVPSSPLQAVFQLAADGALGLADGAKLVSGNPARAVGLDRPRRDRDRPARRPGAGAAARPARHRPASARPTRARRPRRVPAGRAGRVTAPIGAEAGANAWRRRQPPARLLAMIWSEHRRQLGRPPGIGIALVERDRARGRVVVAAG